MADEQGSVTLSVTFTTEQIEAIDAWIARVADINPSREEAVRQLVVGRLGAEGPHTVMPRLVTGRDIV